MNASRDIISMKNNKYIKKWESIKDMNSVAKKMVFLKMSHMTEFNPEYKLTKKSGFSLNPTIKRSDRNSQNSDDEKDPDTAVSTQTRFYEQTTKEELEIMKSIRKA